MEKLTIEQKAKRYDEAIEIARKIKNAEPINAPNGTVIPDVIFPELKEDENDRIRRVIIEYFVGLYSCMFPYKGFTKEQIIAWLEKQGEQKSQGKSALEAIKEENVDNANKVEPKFKVGDWIASKMLNTALIVNIDDDKYEVECIDGDKGFPHIEYVDRYYHLWSIRDAEDGDVLVSLSKMYPFIFNGHYDEDTDYVYAYCGISDIIKDDSFYFDEYPDEEFKVWDSVENVRPATRNQRNLLFQKMKDSGYEWDADKKELKPHYKRIVTNDSRKDLEITT